MGGMWNLWGEKNDGFTLMPVAGPCLVHWFKALFSLLLSSLQGSAWITFGSRFLLLQRLVGHVFVHAARLTLIELSVLQHFIRNLNGLFKKVTFQVAICIIWKEWSSKLLNLYCFHLKSITAVLSNLTLLHFLIFGLEMHEWCVMNERLGWCDGETDPVTELHSTSSFINAQEATFFFFFSDRSLPIYFISSFLCHPPQR